jgi:putative ABC transport system permease protein
VAESPDHASEESKQRRSLRILDELRQDLRYGLRTLTRSPGFSAVAILTLALGVGAVTIIYSVVHNVVVDPLPYRDAGRLVNVFVQDPRGSVRGVFSLPELLDFRDRNSVFEDVVGTLGQGMRYETPDTVEYLRAVWVTPNFFDFMGLPPVLGRAIGAEDGAPGAPPVAVLRHRAWLAYFAGDPQVVGKTIMLDGAPRTIVGVMPPRFTWHAADLWIPGPLDLGAPDAATTVRNFQARLKPGVSLQEAEAQLTVIAAGRAREHPQDYPDKFRIQVVNVIEYTVGPFSGVLYTTLAAVGLLLLIACCNVANMLLARGTTREREMTVRAALGAGRGRIIRQLMLESLLLAAGGSALGCLLAYLGIGALVARLPQNPLPGEVDIALNAPVLAFSLGAAILSAVLFGIAPALYTARRDLVDGLRSGGKGIASGRGWLRNGLVIAEIALSLVLILSAGLVMRSFLSTLRVDLGFEPDNMLVVQVGFPAGGYTTAAERQRFSRDSIARIASLPGVVAASATTTIPPFNAGIATVVEIPGAPRTTDSTAAVQTVMADYFRTLGIDVISGTSVSDSEGTRRVVVNRAFVDRYFKGQDPVGKEIGLTPATGPSDPLRHGTFAVAGVVGNVRNRGLQMSVEPQVYLPWSSAGRSYPTILVRTAVDPRGVVNAIRHELSLVDRKVAVLPPRTMPEVLDRSFYAQPRFSLLVLGIFAATGTFLVAAGVFSVMAYTVSRQKREIAVRMALGASRTQVFSTIVRLGVQLLAMGAVTGLLASFATARLLSTQLGNVSPHDPVTLVAATAVISIVALAACYLPARRAMRVDPIGALRDE